MVSFRSLVWDILILMIYFLTHLLTVSIFSWNILNPLNNPALSIWTWWTATPACLERNLLKQHQSDIKLCWMNIHIVWIWQSILQFMGLQRVGHDLASEQYQQWIWEKANIPVRWMSNYSQRKGHITGHISECFCYGYHETPLTNSVVSLHFFILLDFFTEMAIVLTFVLETLCIGCSTNAFIIYPQSHSLFTPFCPCPKQWCFLGINH